MYATFWDAGVDIWKARVMCHNFLGQNIQQVLEKGFKCTPRHARCAMLTHMHLVICARGNARLVITSNVLCKNDQLFRGVRTCP